MPQAKRAGSSSRASTSGSGTAKRSASKRSASSSARGGGRGSGSKAKGAAGASSESRAGSARSTSSASTKTASATGASDPRAEAIADRIRKLNERIIEASKGAGEVTLSSYEKALKTIASSLERGPGSSDVEWISNLATVQAKFIRDVTSAWTSAAREMMK